MASPLLSRVGSVLLGLEGFDHHRNDFEQVAADAVVGSFEDGGGLILVDRDDALGILHAGQVLDRAGNAEGNIDLGTDGLAGLSDLAGDLAPARVDTGAGTGDLAAKQFGISKSTVHKDITERLRQINRNLGEQVAVILEQNKDERHIRGGMATREKYLHREIEG